MTNPLKQLFRSLAAVSALLIYFSCANTQEPSSSLRAPSYPLITIDPYTSIWSPADELYAVTTEHWTGFPNPLQGILTVDGKDYRFLGKRKAYDYTAIAAGAREHNWEGSYSVDGGANWEEGMGAFGPKGRKPMTCTFVNSHNLKVRREVTIPEQYYGAELYLMVTTIGDSEFYANGIKVASTSGRQEIVYLPIPAEAMDEAEANGGRMILEGSSRMEGKDVFVDMGVYIKTEYQDPYPTCAEQLSASVLPMNTLYSFRCGPVLLDLKFTAPLFLDDLDLLSRPVNYISYDIASTDGQKHDVSIRFEAGRECAVDYATDEKSVGDTFREGNLVYAYTRCTDQNPLWKSGDGVRIDWGSFYLAAESKGATVAEASSDGDIAIVRELGRIDGQSGMIMVGYDDIESIQYFGENLRAWWNKDGNSSIQKQFQAAAGDYRKLMRKTAAFDASLMNEAALVGGQKYAEICALAYRQSICAHKLVESPKGEILWLSKENNSNGSINTVDVTYPSTPLYFIYNPSLVEGMMNGIFEYSESGRWTKPFPAHDIGTYPLANGQTYGGDMPVEEAGNMLILSAALCKFQDSGAYAAKHWEVLSEWAGYLSKFGLDPEDQLCTDDFAGKFAHNVNLSVKAILGLASYGEMADILGYEDIADKYEDMAESMAKEWERMANDGDHYRLCFDKPGTWSQKYNLIWDELLDLDIFPDGIMEKEIPYYMTKFNEWGLPLDCRKDYTKTDWIIWTASMAESMSDFTALTDPVWKYYNETVERVPMGDWVNTADTHRPGFKARSVVGGIFMKLLCSRQ